MKDPATEPGPGPLDGVRVLDLSRVMSGPHCTRMLVDLGADVIKVEPPEGDLTRFSYPRVNSIATYFTQQNCGKRNLSLDLRRPEAVELVAGLAERVDVMVENFRPGVMDRMGLGWEAMAARNPRLVYASITGYGHTGPWVSRRAYAPVVHAESGITWEQGKARGGGPGAFRNDVLDHGDAYAALECLAGVLAALFQRERTGHGQWVEVSMAETMLAVNEHVHWHLRPDADAPVVDVPSFAPGDFPVLPTADGRTIVVSGHPASNGAFEGYCRVIGRDDLLNDPTLATVAQRLGRVDEIVAAMAAWAATQSDFDAIEAAFAAEGFAIGVMRTVREIADTPWATARGAVVAVDDRGGGQVRIPNSPWHFSDADSGVRGAPAYRGEHNRDVLAELLGLDYETLDRLEADGVLSSRVPS